MSPEVLTKACISFLNSYAPSTEVEIDDLEINQSSLSHSEVDMLYKRKKQSSSRFSMQYKVDKKNVEQQIFTERPETIGLDTYPYIFKYTGPVSKIWESTIGVYFISLNDEVIYIGDTNNSLKKRIDQFICGLNFGKGHVCANKICWLKNQDLLLGLINRNVDYVSDSVNMIEALTNLNQTIWHKGLTQTSLLEKVKAAKTFTINSIMLPKHKGYDLATRRVISMLESYAILSVLKEGGALPLNYD